MSNKRNIGIDNRFIADQIGHLGQQMCDLATRIADGGTEPLNKQEKNMARQALAHNWLQDMFREAEHFFIKGYNDDFANNLHTVTETLDRLMR